MERADEVRQERAARRRLPAAGFLSELKATHAARGARRDSGYSLSFFETSETGLVQTSFLLLLSQLISSCVAIVIV